MRRGVMEWFQDNEGLAPTRRSLIERWQSNVYDAPFIKAKGFGQQHCAPASNRQRMEDLLPNPHTRGFCFMTLRVKQAESAGR